MYPESLGTASSASCSARPYVTEQLSGERLGRPLRLGVLAPDCISSSAYGTEEILTQMTPFIGLAAFALVVPIMFVIIGVLFFVTMSYLDVIKYYTPPAGPTWWRARISVRGSPRSPPSRSDRLHRDRRRAVLGRDRRAHERLPRLDAYAVEITVGIVLILIYGNLRGLQRGGELLRLPDVLLHHRC